MQIQRHHIAGGESALGQLREEQFVDDAVTFDTDLALLWSSGMGRDHDPAACAQRPDGHLIAVVERAHELRFPDG